MSDATEFPEDEGPEGKWAPGADRPRKPAGRRFVGPWPDQPGPRTDRIQNVPARYADVAMYPAPPIAEKGQKVEPRVTLISMTANPLRVAAAVNATYHGGVYRDPSEVPDAEVNALINAARNSKLKAPLEWIQLDWYLEGVSRAMTHQIVRQRTATFAQESMRFAVKENIIDEIIQGPWIASHEPGSEIQEVCQTMTNVIAWGYNRLIDLGAPAEEARDYLPTGTATRIHWRTDLRNLLAVAGDRLCSQAQYHWKVVFSKMIEQILAYGPEEERWQQEVIASLFGPVCYLTGKCEFMGPDDRWCVIRDRVEAHHKAGDLPDSWTDIDPREPLQHWAARKTANVK